MARRRYSYYGDYFFEPSRPLDVEGGIKARSRRGEFAKNWWAGRWIKAMERLVDAGRLQRGRSYARRGQVLSIDETAEGVTARVQGSRRQPYRVTIRVSPLSDRAWEQVIDALAEQAIFSAQLLAGEMPPDIEEAFAAAGVSLFPDRRGELETDCSCPDWANPCKHVAATHYILGERFDEDPFLLFRLRGRGQEQALAALRQRRAGPELEEEEPDAAPVVPLEETLDRFWEPGEALAGFPLAIKPPAAALPILKRLGEPGFLAGDSLAGLLGPVYERLSRAALGAAFGGGAEGEDGGEG